jgi:predicted PurR-regulated permease PerM
VGFRGDVSVLPNDKTTQQRLGTVLFYGIVIVIAYLTFLVFQPFLAPLAWAVVIVVIMHPYYDRLTKKTNPTMAALLMTAIVTLILIVPTVLVMTAFVKQGVQAITHVQSQVQSGHFDWVNNLWLKLQDRLPEENKTDLSTLVSKYFDAAAAYGAARVGAILRNTAAFLFHLSVMILAMFYLFRDGDSIVERLRVVLPFEHEHRDRMIGEAHDLIFASVVSSAVAAAAHGILGGIAFALTGITAPVFWGVMMGFFSLVPVVGSALIWVPAVISLMVQGHPVAGIILAIICGVVVGVVDNVIRPWVISGRAEMGGLIVFISVLGGLAVFGMLGLVLGPIIVATGASILDLYAAGVRPGATVLPKRGTTPAP